MVCIHIAVAFAGAFLASVEAEPISLPIRQELAPLELDGQALNLRVDSGTARSFAIYGPAFEQLEGEGSCLGLLWGCYFCPTDNPCDDISSRKRWRATYVDGVHLEYVEHYVTLRSGNVTVPDFKFGLALNFSRFPGTNTTQPLGLLGLSIGGCDIPETFLEQLRRREVISSLVYSIRAEEQDYFMVGNLTLDDTSTADLSPVPFSSHSRRCKRLLDVYGNRHDRNGEIEMKQTHVVAFVDSGASPLDISDAEFKSIVEVTAAAMARDERVLSPGSTEELIWEDPDSGFYMITTAAVPHLPALAYYVGEQPHGMEIRIQPKHYLSECDQSRCQLDIAPSPDGRISLGHPLFRAYDVKFDLSNYQLYLSPHVKNAEAFALP
ncbi:hypothetical protein FOZ61_009256 [Perkinsus olseni]|uniref:Peptidase A1 domain-containing protein n=1 Tax=Perkinsus olseni TaxID=32597 RepID=A0A7J6L7C8_PEROL|nr:hypothetical protein FOZ61_009256 [Perkinsus olseni]KAF4655107.1 hypothetical protein FOL46_008385 [Perkinsus olseni]